MSHGRTNADARFETLLQKAADQADAGRLEVALDTYWQARNHAKSARLRRCGEADMGLGMILVDLGRVNEGLEAIRRACRFFAEDGRIFFRGTAHVALAEVALIKERTREALRHLDLAEDLFRGTGQELLAARAVKFRAEIHDRVGEPEAAAQAWKVARLLGASVAAQSARRAQSSSQSSTQSGAQSGTQSGAHGGSQTTKSTRNDAPHAAA